MKVLDDSDQLDARIKNAVAEAIRSEIPHIIREVTAKPWLTKQDLKELTGWSDRTIQNLRDTDQIPFSKHGGKILYPRQGVMEFLEEHEIKPRK